MRTGSPTRYGPAMTTTEELLQREDAAWSAFEENEKGSLATGKLADFVVLSRDILSIPPNQIVDAIVDATVVGGKIVFSR